MATLGTSRKAGMSNEALQLDSTATPFSTFISAAYRAISPPLKRCLPTISNGD